MTGSAFHPKDLDEICQFIRTDSLEAAEKVINEITAAVRSLVAFLDRGHRRADLTFGPFTLPPCP